MRDRHPKERQAAKLARKKASRNSHDRILIICEGKKTEPQYFNEIRQFYRLNTAYVSILQSEYGTSPQQVVDYARDKCLETRQWEQVFCVFDRDEHPSFNNALQSANTLDKKHKNEYKQPILFKAIPSIPCFELWLLLHFECVTREMQRDEVCRRLDRPGLLPGYSKGSTGQFKRTMKQLSEAYENAARAKEERQRTGRENPFTAVDELVILLTSLKSE